MKSGWLVVIALCWPTLGGVRAQAFEVVYNRPFAARCNGPLGAIIVRDMRMVGAAAAGRMVAVRRARVREALVAQHNPAALYRAARPIRLLAQRGVIRGPARVSFPRPLVHVTEAEQIILPDLVSAQQGGQTIGDPTNELTFVFEGFDEGTEAALRDYLSVAVPVARRVYGPPAFNLTVKIINDPDVQDIQGGYYDVAANEIHLAPLTGNFVEDTFVLIKLVLHAFHDDTIFFFDAWEEGFAGAAAMAVQTTPGVSPGYNPYDPGPFYCSSVYECENQPALGNSTFYPRSGFGGMLVWRIAMARAAWFKCYIEDPEFFARFNQEYYRRYTPALAGDTPGLKDIAASVLPQVEGMSFYEWYERQHVLDTSIRVGPKLFTWNIPLPQSVALIVEHYQTTADGDELPRGGQATTIYWSYDFSVSLYAEEGNVISIPESGEGAGEGFLIPTFFNIGGPQRITVQLDLNGLRAYYPYPYGMRGFQPGENNIYGAVIGAISGSIDIAGPDSASDVSVSRGVWGTEVQGGNLSPSQITVTFTDESGDQNQRTVNVAWDSYALFLRGGAHVTARHTYRQGVHMMSLPLYTLSPSAPDVLGIAPERLLLARWDPRLGTSGRYRLWPDIDPFAPGKAFWLKVFEDTEVSVRGIPTDPVVDFPVALSFGWNMVGVPRQFAVNVTDLRVQLGTDPPVTFDEAVARHWVQASIFGYSMQRGYERVERLLPYLGYWVRSLVTSEVRLLFPPEGETTAATAAAGGSCPWADWRWAARICVRSAGEGGNVVVGRAGGGPEVIVPAPPASPGGLRVAVTHVGNRSLDGPAYASGVAGGTKGWRVLVTGAPRAEVSVAIEPVAGEELPELGLAAEGTGRVWLASVQPTRTVHLNEQGELLLRVDVLRDRDEAQPVPVLTGVAARVAGSGATVVYTLAAPAYVQARVVNIAGRLVRRLASGRLQAAGRNTLVWNGCNDSGAKAPAGRYLVMVEAKGTDGARQRAIVPLNLVRR